MATYINEVLVLNSAASRIDTGLSYRKAIEIQNLGPNAIYVGLGVSTTAVLTKSRKVNPGEAWSISLCGEVPVYAIAVSADQVTGAATIVTEVQG